MKIQNEIKKKFLELRANLLSAVAELDLRGTDPRITEAMCVIEVTVDAALLSKKMSARNAAKLALALAWDSQVHLATSRLSIHDN